jgi:hypothetical protein
MLQEVNQIQAILGVTSRSVINANFLSGGMRGESSAAWMEKARASGWVLGHISLAYCRILRR